VEAVQKPVLELAAALGARGPFTEALKIFVLASQGPTERSGDPELARPCGPESSVRQLSASERTSGRSEVFRPSRWNRGRLVVNLGCQLWLQSQAAGVPYQMRHAGVNDGAGRLSGWSQGVGLRVFRPRLCGPCAPWTNGGQHPRWLLG
jgi:hypothetical protein